MYLQKVISRKKCVKNYFFAGILKVNDENSRIRIQDPNPDPEARIRGSRFGSTPKCHGSGTLIGNSQKIWGFGQDHGLFAEPDSELGFSWPKLGANFS
jgi:hypothetical protein